MFKTPQFWHCDSLLSRFLKPLSWIYCWLAEWKESHRKPYRVSVPVICVGNLVMGGAGKTPAVIAIVKILQEIGHQPHILSRGYGGYFRDVARVDANKHTYLQVGDEPLLLSAHAPTWVGASRVATAQAAIEAGATILVMDDGLQNSRLMKDYSLIVIDCIQGLGNNLVFPAGPLREPLQKGLKRAQAVLFVGDKKNFNKPEGLRTFNHQYTARLTATSSLKPQPVVAFAGIGYPEKFRHTLEEQGFLIKDFIDFADHHPYTIIDMQKLERLAHMHNVPLITTEKDYFRIPASYKDSILTLPVVLQFDRYSSFQKVLGDIFSVKNNDT